MRGFVEEKLPESSLCKRRGGANVELFELRVKVGGILIDIAKHLVAMKESQNRSSKEARRSYLQDLRNRFAPVEAPALVQLMKSILEENNEDSSDYLLQFSSSSGSQDISAELVSTSSGSVDEDVTHRTFCDNRLPTSRSSNTYQRDIPNEITEILAGREDSDSNNKYNNDVSNSCKDPYSVDHSSRKSSSSSSQAWKCSSSQSGSERASDDGASYSSISSDGFRSYSSSLSHARRCTSRQSGSERANDDDASYSSTLYDGSWSCYSSFSQAS